MPTTIWIRQVSHQRYPVTTALVVYGFLLLLREVFLCHSLTNRQLLFLSLCCGSRRGGITVFGSSGGGSGVARPLVLDLLDLFGRGRVSLEGNILPLLGRLVGLADGLDQIVEPGCDCVLEELWG